MRIAAAIALCPILIGCSHAQQITVAAAADLTAALDEIVGRFEPRSGAQVKLVYGASGNLYEQIRQGAPFDIFFAANTDYPKRLEAAGFGVPGTYCEYARGKIVLIARSNAKLDLRRGLRVLLDAAVKKVAIADPSHAPYGQAAVEALRSERLYESVSVKIVRGESVSQAASFVFSGAADAAIVALSTALAHAGANFAWVEIPARDYPPIVQAAVVLRSSRNQELARRFESYVMAPEAITILKRHGFDAPRSGTKP